jgi:hypothetical protein
MNTDVAPRWSANRAIRRRPPSRAKNGLPFIELGVGTTGWSAFGGACGAGGWAPCWLSRLLPLQGSKSSGVAPPLGRLVAGWAGPGLAARVLSSSPRIPTSVPDGAFQLKRAEGAGTESRRAGTPATGRGHAAQRPAARRFRGTAPRLSPSLS